jgi:hypothetical protein
MIKRLVFVLVFVTVVLVVHPRSAKAQPLQCSEFNYAPIDARRALVEADAAIIGTIEPGSSYTADQPGTFRTEQAVKGKVVRVIAVDAVNWNHPPSGGERVGLLLFRGDQAGQHFSSACTLSPEKLRRAAEPLPPTYGKNPAVLFAGGSFGEARVVALDSAGRTLAYGAGKGITTFLSICPGGERVVEVVADGYRMDSKTSLAVRDLTTLDVIRNQPLLMLQRSGEMEGGPAVGSISCRDHKGEEVLMWILRSVPGDADSWVSRIMLLTPRKNRDLLKGPLFGGVEFSNSEFMAYANSGGHDGQVFRLDLEKGTSTRIARTPERGYFGGPSALSPEGSRLAWGLSGQYLQTDDQIVMFDLTTTPVGVKKVTMPRQFLGHFTWVDNQTLAVGRLTDESAPVTEVRTYDHRLRLKGQIGNWQGWHIHASLNGVLYGAGGQNSLLVQTRIPNGQPQTLTSFEPFAPTVLVSIPHGINVTGRAIKSSKISGEIIETTHPSPTPASPSPQASPSKARAAEEVRPTAPKTTNLLLLVLPPLALSIGIVALLWRRVRTRGRTAA